jgi:sugar phosphate isomerase/epimerase
MEMKNYARKDFLKLLGTGTAALAFPGIIFPEDHSAGTIGFQLYSVRKEIEKDFDTTIRTIARMGYLGVETYPLPDNVTLEHAAKIFKETGLEVFSIHTDLPVGPVRDTALRVADTYECKNIVYHSWPDGLSSSDPDLFKKTSEIFKTIDDMKKRADIYNTITDDFYAHGFRFGLHNHWWEFQKSDGVYPSYYFLEHVNDNMFFEIDTYWAKTAGQDPAEVLKDFGKRAPFLHIKDGPATQDNKMYAQVPAGSGSLDFPTIVKAGSKNIKWMIVEFDEYSGDMEDGIQQSYSYLTKNGLATGRV